MDNIPKKGSRWGVNQIKEIKFRREVVEGNHIAKLMKVFEVGEVRAKCPFTVTLCVSIYSSAEISFNTSKWFCRLIGVLNWWVRQKYFISASFILTVYKNTEVQGLLKFSREAIDCNICFNYLNLYILRKKTNKFMLDFFFDKWLRAEYKSVCLRNKAFAENLPVLEIIVFFMTLGL